MVKAEAIVGALHSEALKILKLSRPTECSPMTRKKPLKELTYLLHKVEVALNSLTSWANFFFF